MNHKYIKLFIKSIKSFISEFKALFIFAGLISFFISIFVSIPLIFIWRDTISPFFPFFLVFFISFISVILLASRDKRQRKKYIKNRSVEECIKEIEKIRKYGESAPIELEKMKKDFQNHDPDNERAWSWINPVIEFNQRFAALAASEDTTPEQAEALRDEVIQYMKQNKGKYPVAGDNLADLIRERNLKTKKENHK